MKFEEILMVIVSFIFGLFINRIINGGLIEGIDACSKRPGLGKPFRIPSDKSTYNKSNLGIDNCDNIVFRADEGAAWDKNGVAITNNAKTGKLTDEKVREKCNAYYQTDLFPLSNQGNVCNGGYETFIDKSNGPPPEVEEGIPFESYKCHKGDRCVSR
jgi:hypothetical protein